MPSLPQLLTVGMVSVLKNITNLFTIFGDIAFYGMSYGTRALSCPEALPIISNLLFC